MTSQRVLSPLVASLGYEVLRPRKRGLRVSWRGIGDNQTGLGAKAILFFRSVGRWVGPSIMLSLFGLLGATVCTVMNISNSLIVWQNEHTAIPEFHMMSVRKSSINGVLTSYHANELLSSLYCSAMNGNLPVYM